MSMAGVKGKRKRLKPDNPAQSAKFIKSARKLGLGGKGDAFDKALDDLLRSKKPKSAS